MTAQRKLLRTKEADEYCGFKLSYFRKLMMRRAIPMYKPCGKLCFFKKEDLDTFPVRKVSKSSFLKKHSLPQGLYIGMVRRIISLRK